MPSITNGKNPRMGIDWKISKSGRMTASARLFLAANIPTTSAKMILSPRANIILIQETRMSRVISPNWMDVVPYQQTPKTRWLFTNFSYQIQWILYITSIEKDVNSHFLPWMKQDVGSPLITFQSNHFRILAAFCGLWDFTSSRVPGFRHNGRYQIACFSNVDIMINVLRPYHLDLAQGIIK